MVEKTQAISSLNRVGVCQNLLFPSDLITGEQMYLGTSAEEPQAHNGTGVVLKGWRAVALTPYQHPDSFRGRIKRVGCARTHR
jgi:hypothetical protein